MVLQLWERKTFFSLFPLFLACHLKFIRYSAFFSMAANPFPIGLLPFPGSISNFRKIRPISAGTEAFPSVYFIGGKAHILIDSRRTNASKHIFARYREILCLSLSLSKSIDDLLFLWIFYGHILDMSISPSTLPL